MDVLRLQRGPNRPHLSYWPEPFGLEQRTLGIASGTKQFIALNGKRSCSARLPTFGPARPKVTTTTNCSCSCWFGSPSLWLVGSCCWFGSPSLWFWLQNYFIPYYSYSFIINPLSTASLSHINKLPLNGCVLYLPPCPVFHNTSLKQLCLAASTNILYCKPIRYLLASTILYHIYRKWIVSCKSFGRNSMQLIILDAAQLLTEK